MAETERKRGILTRTIFRVGRGLRTSLVGVGALTTAAAAYYVYQEKIVKGADEKKKKKQVLVIPFDRLKLVEQEDHRNAFLSNLSNDDDGQPEVEMTVRDVVKAIHEAAADPDIVALYGTFGGMPATGWGDLEEVRDALR